MIWLQNTEEEMIMIKDVTLIPFKKFNPLPTYAKNVRVYTLIAIIPGGYEITLAKNSCSQIFINMV